MIQNGSLVLVSIACRVINTSGNVEAIIPVDAASVKSYEVIAFFAL